MKIMNGLFESIVIVIIGMLIGSTINMLVYRLPIILKLKKCQHPFEHFNLFFPRSHCPSCHHIIACWHNIPVISYIMLRGKCAYCHASISKRYIFTELAFPVLMLGIYIFHPDWQYVFLGTWFCILTYTMSAIDTEMMILPDVLNYILLWTGLWINSFHYICSLDHAVYGAMMAYISLWAIYHIFVKLTGKHGFGYGDFKLYAAIGAWFGITQIFFILIVACVVGIAIALVQMTIHKHKKWKEPMPFGPALAIAGYLFLLWN